MRVGIVIVGNALLSNIIFKKSFAEGLEKSGETLTLKSPQRQKVWLVFVIFIMLSFVQGKNKVFVFRSVVSIYYTYNIFCFGSYMG